MRFACRHFREYLSGEKGNGVWNNGIHEQAEQYRLVCKFYGGVHLKSNYFSMYEDPIIHFNIFQFRETSLQLIRRATQICDCLLVS